MIAQSPDLSTLSIAVRRIDGGRVSPRLNDLVNGAQPWKLRVSEPGGSTYMTAAGQPMVCFVAGVGATLAASIAHHAKGEQPLHVEYNARDTSDFIFENEFHEKAKQHSWFTCHFRADSTDGYLGESDVKRIVEKFPTARFYLCGPVPYMTNVRKHLLAANIPSTSIEVEEFFVQDPGATKSPTTPPTNVRRWAYRLAFAMALLPLLLLWGLFEDNIPHHAHMAGHEKLVCKDCHEAAPGTLRQQLQAKAKALVGMRQTTAPFLTKTIDNSTCLQCHQRPDDRHPSHRFMEPRFADARADLQVEQCVACHREHEKKAVTIPDSGYCVACHHDLKVEKDPAQPSHKALIDDKRWDTCLTCHDFHGNHKWKAPKTLEKAIDQESVQAYLRSGSKSPYGEILVKAIKQGGQK